MASGPGITGLRRDTWNDGASRQCCGKLIIYVTPLICLRILYGPI